MERNNNINNRHVNIIRLSHCRVMLHVAVRYIDIQSVPVFLCVTNQRRFRMQE